MIAALSTHAATRCLRPDDVFGTWQRPIQCPVAGSGHVATSQTEPGTSTVNISPSFAVPVGKGGLLSSSLQSCHHLMCCRLSFVAKTFAASGVPNQLIHFLLTDRNSGGVSRPFVHFHDCWKGDQEKPKLLVF